MAVRLNPATVWSFGLLGSLEPQNQTPLRIACYGSICQDLAALPPSLQACSRWPPWVCSCCSPRHGARWLPPPCQGRLLCIEGWLGCPCWAVPNTVWRCAHCSPMHPGRCTPCIPIPFSSCLLRYVKHRSLVVASVRIASAALLLLHVYLDPCESRGSAPARLATVAAGWGHQPAAAGQIVLTATGCCRAPLTHPFPDAPPPAAFYSGSLLKGLAGSCALTLLIAPLRNRLRFRWAVRPACLACSVKPVVRTQEYMGKTKKHLASPATRAATTCSSSWPSSTCAA